MLKRLLLLSALALLLVLFNLFDLGQYLTFEAIKAHQQALQQIITTAPLLSALIYGLVYVLATALSIPGAALLTLLGGALFGLVYGTLLISFASTIGATLAFLISRFLLRDLVQRRWGQRLAAVNRSIERDGAFYLLSLRLVPLFPFFLINLLMGLTPLRTRSYYWISQLGMLPATVVYVNAGTQLASLESPAGLLSPALLGSFALLALFPWLAKGGLALLLSRRVYRQWQRQKPSQFDRNLVVIGGGSAGLVTAYISAAVKADVTLIEKHRMGGDCLNTGCVPSKALIRTSRFIAEARRARELGLDSVSTEFSFATVMERVQRVIKTVEPHDSVERYTALGVEVLEGEAEILSPWQVKVNGQVLTTRQIVIATGARPFVPPIPGLEQMQPLTSDTIWSLRQQPRRLLVLGGGPIGCELAQCFARLGCEVTQVEMAPRVLPREDDEVSLAVQQRMQHDGVCLFTGAKAVSFTLRAGEKYLQLEQEGQLRELAFDQVLVAIGRRANTEGFGAEKLDLELTPTGTLAVNEYLQTRYPNIFAAGDVAGPYQFTHTAAHQAWYASVNALFGGLRKFRADYSVIPAATFVDPEVARVGLNEQEARQQGIPYEVSRYELSELDRAIADEEAHGFVKVLTVPGRDRILGATIVGSHAGELISEFVTAMKHSLGLNSLLGTIHIYPTLMEANKYVAGQWKRAHAPAWAYPWLRRYHAWLRNH